jgi:galactokinase
MSINETRVEAPAGDEAHRARAAASEFICRYGRTPQVSSAPGRVNLIGEHTDYNDGYVMPAAIEYSTLVAASPRSERLLRVYSNNVEQERIFDLDAPGASRRGDWSDYVFGVAAMLEKSGRRLQGADLLVTSDVPIGAGLSSSAALEVATTHALLAASGLPFDPVQAARISQRAENEFVGMRCGIMDQYIAARGVAGCALLIDCRTLEARNVALAPNLRLLIADSRVRHQHDGGEYNARREACEEGVRRLQPWLGPIKALRDVTVERLEAHKDALSDLVYRRCRHIVTENERVLEAERALAARDFAAAGRAMNASHVHMRDDFEITCPEVDYLAALAQGLPGVWGSRMTGGGFGGCTITLIEASAVEAAAERIVEAYRGAYRLDANVFICAPSQGAHFVAI